MMRAVHPLGTIRALGRHEQTLHRDHLLRLDADGRRDRFNGVADDLFITRYSERCFAGPTCVFALIDDQGEVRGTAELHPPLKSEPADVAFSVEPHLRRKGIATALFEAVIEGARAEAIGELRITSSAGNLAMRALARKFGARFIFEAGEATGLLPVRPADRQAAAASGRMEARPAA